MIKINLAPERVILAQFAWVAAIMFPLLSAFLAGWHWGSPWVLGASAVGGAQLLLFLLGVETPTRWLFLALSIVALPIGFVLSHVLMAAIFYLMITPIGLVFRLIGRDTMGKRLDKALSTYWHDRGPARRADSYFKLY